MEISQINHLIEEKRRKRNRPMIQSLMWILYKYRKYKQELEFYKMKKIEYSSNPTKSLDLTIQILSRGLQGDLDKLKRTIQEDLDLLNGDRKFNGKDVKISEPDQYIPIWEMLIEEIETEEIELDRIKVYRSELEILKEENNYLKMKIQRLEEKNGN